MGTIKLTNIRTFSYHGCLEEEAKIGSNYKSRFNYKNEFKTFCQKQMN